MLNEFVLPRPENVQFRGCEPCQLRASAPHEFHRAIMVLIGDIYVPRGINRQPDEIVSETLNGSVDCVPDSVSMTTRWLLSVM